MYKSYFVQLFNTGKQKWIHKQKPFHYIIDQYMQLMKAKEMNSAWNFFLHFHTDFCLARISSLFFIHMIRFYNYF